MTTMIVYKSGDDNLLARIEAALEAFERKHGARPASVTVNKSEMARAEAMFPWLEVRGSGGCLVGEVWLEKPREDEGK
jgi:hypothetical protein